MANLLACFLALQALSLCRALPACPKLKCSVNCEFGHASDENGCPTCQCRDACSVFSETPLCPKGQKCSNDRDSPKGYKCIQMHSSDESCDLYCEFGFLNDKTGCNVCECKPNPCDNVTCFKGETCVVNLTLPHGYECTLTGYTWCSDFMCDMVCEYGFETDLAGCDVCICRKEPCVGPLCPLAQREDPNSHEEPGPLVACDPRVDKNCKPECPLVTCPCSTYKLDSNGCQTCSCPPTDSKTTPEPVECMPLTCLCPDQKEGSDGCPVCDCPHVTSTTTAPAINTAPIRTAVMCLQVTCTCSNYKLDSNGCQDCDCPDISTTTLNPVTCVEVTCRCSNYKYDSNGCRDCDCPDISTTTPTRPVTCVEVTCRCSNYKYDSNGCRDCDCPDISTTTPTRPVECMPLTCLCPDQKEGSDGCPVCDCPHVTSTTTAPAINTAPIRTAVMCLQVTCTCSNYKLDSNGCQECDCPDICTTTPTRPASKCPNFQCLLYCEFGFVRNSLGCEICQCRSDPCINNTCADKEVCQADDSARGYVCIPQGAIWCSEEGCELICESGYETGENGCDICKCKEVICNGHVCPSGFECGEVTRGCKQQTCDPVVEQMCVKVKPCDWKGTEENDLSRGSPGLNSELQ